MGERVVSSNHEVRKWFMYYLDQLLGIQCERISNRSRKTDNRDNIYDIDTVNGSFIWKNELRKHWIRSRLERKKLMQQKPPTNPFIDAPIEIIIIVIMTMMMMRIMVIGLVSMKEWIMIMILKI